MMSLQGINLTVTLFVTSEAVSSERRFEKSLTIGDLKNKLQPITGIPSNHMRIQLFSKVDQLLGTLEGDSKMLGMFHVEDYMRINVINTDSSRIKGEFTDLSLVEKYEMNEKEYDKLPDSVRAFKKKNKLGRFAEQDPEEIKRLEQEFFEEASKIQIDDRCEVEISDEGMKKRGRVAYVGKTDFKPGYWVGIQYDEPIGKHDGSVQGKRYFTCPNKYGAFVRPNKVKVGNFPEEDFDDLDEF